MTIQPTNTNIYNSDAPVIWKLSTSRVAVIVNGFCMATLPSDKAADYPDAPESCRSEMRRFLEEKPTQQALISLGDLTSWLLRRCSLYTACSECDLCGGSFGRREGDAQVALGAIFDRQWVREALQWLYETRVPMTDMVHVRTVPTTARRTLSTGELFLGHVLVMSHGDWNGIVMSCKENHDFVSADPLVAS